MFQKKVEALPMKAWLIVAVSGPFAVIAGKDDWFGVAVAALVTGLLCWAVEGNTVERLWQSRLYCALQYIFLIPVLAYFASTQVSRDRAREEALAVLQNVVDSAEADSAEKAQALEDIATIANNIEAEANIEAMVMAKGFEQCVAIVNDGMCTVVVMTEELLAAHMSQINEIVYEQTGIKPVNVKYIQKS